MRIDFTRGFLILFIATVVGIGAFGPTGPGMGAAEAARIKASQLEVGMRFTGKARVVDAGTLAFGRTLVKLDGIVAPPRHKKCLRFDGSRARPAWNCGAQAARAMHGLAHDGKLICIITGKRRSALVGSCKRRGVDLAEAMVRRGLAHVSRGPVAVKLASVQNIARQSGHGIWQGQLAVPLQWRQGGRTDIAKAGERALGDRIRQQVSISVG